MRERSFFDLVVQLAAVLTAFPVVGVLTFTIFEAMSGYRFERLRIRLLKLVRDDLSRTSEHEPANLKRDALATRKKTLATIERQLAEHDEAALQRREALSDELTARLLKTLHGGSILERLHDRAALQAEVCEQRLCRWLKNAVPLTVARCYGLRLAVEIARLGIQAARDSGLALTLVLMHRAGRDVTNGGLAGVVIGILVWSVGTRYHGRFVDYIGTGGTLGGFVGLAVTSVVVIRAVRAHYRAGRHVPGPAWVIVVLVVPIEVWQLLIYFGVFSS